MTSPSPSALMTPALRAQQKPRSDTRSAVRQLIRSHKHLLAAFRAQTEEIGILRRYILELRAQHAPTGFGGLNADKAREAYFNAKDYQFRSPNDWPRL